MALQYYNYFEIKLQKLKVHSSILQLFSDEGASVKITDLKKCVKKKEEIYGKGWPLLDANASTQILVSTFYNIVKMTI